MNSQGFWKKSIHTVVPLIVLVAFLVMAVTVFATTVTVDTFDADSLRGIAGPGAGSSDSGYVNSAEAIGGQREVYVYNTTGLGDVSIAIDYGDTNQAKFNQDSGVQGWGRIVWDGTDNDPLTIDTTGLGGTDLTDGGNNNGFQLLVYYCDGGFDLQIYVYAGAQTASYVLNIPSQVPAPGQSFFIPFADFVGDYTFGSAGAIEFRIVPDAESVDLTVYLFEATAQTDWGDLPENGTSYPTSLANNGPRHIRGPLYLGPSIDLEADGFPSVYADGDDLNNYDDEDGITRQAGEGWGDNETAHLDVVVTGGTGDLYAWFDWNMDGDFDDTGEALSWTGLTAGTHSLALTVDPAFAQGGLYARFRLVPNGASAPDYYGEVTNGEVEDYYWPVVPTAVTLTRFEAQAKKAAIVLTWETASEIDNLGFNIYRAESAKGPFTKLNKSLIPSQVPPGSPIGATYTFRDRTARPGVKYFYKLESVDIYGNSAFHGPIDAQIKPRAPKGQ
jgi:hypothetical protein